MTDNDKSRRAVDYMREMAGDEPPFRGDETVPVPEDLTSGQHRVQRLIEEADDPDEVGIEPPIDAA
jgi:hypothetical protein